MLSMPTVHIVRRTVLAEGLRVRQVAHDLGLSRTTVYKDLEVPTPAREEATPRRHPVVDAVARCLHPPAMTARRLYGQRPRGASVRAPAEMAGGGSLYTAALSCGRVS